ncbi:MAG: hypothetical protein DRJ42_09785, partial [Deltaproteobacteria bacterium]
MMTGLVLAGALLLPLAACNSDAGDPALDPNQGEADLAPAPHDEDIASATPDAELPAVGDQVGAPFDLGAVMRQVHFAYRPDGDAHTGGDSTYGVRVEGGAVQLTPYHHPGGVPVGTEEAAPEPLDPAAMGADLA